MLLSRDLLDDVQVGAVDFTKATPRCALWIDCGVGKTVIILTAVADLISDFEVGRVLIVAPPRVARVTWPDEVAAWEHTRHLEIEHLSGGPAKRAKTLAASRADITTLNVDQVAWLVDHYRETPDRPWPFDMVVIDEASGFGDPSSARFKSMRKVAGATTRFVEATGTPASNGLLKVWSQICLLDSGARLGKAYSTFQKRYFDSDYMGYNWTPREDTEQSIREAIADLVLVIKTDRPEVDPTDVLVDLPPAAREQYRELEREALLEFDSRAVVTAATAAVSVQKLLQMANGAVYPDLEEGEVLPPGPRPFEAVHDAKLDELAVILDWHAYEPVIVVYNFKSDVARICERFPHAELLTDRPDNERRWNNGEIPLMLIHPKSAGHGLNIQFGGRVLVWFGLPWSLELYHQTIKRLDRRGQHLAVIAYRLLAANTADGSVVNTLAGNNATQRAFLTALRADMERRAT